MNSEWQQKMADHGLVQNGNDFVYPGGVDAVDAICTLSSVTVLHISGADAESFLQAQFSNDISALENPASQLSTWSSPKGRVITLFRVVRIEDGYVVCMPTELLEPVLKRLRMYVLMAKVVIEPRDDLIVIGVSGAAGEEALLEAGIEMPRQINSVAVLPDNGWITRVPGESRFELIATPGQLAQIWDACTPLCQVTSEAAWRLQNIDAGIPAVGAETTEAFVLQMLNLQHIGGVSFKKGCFPGQEVVARMQYLGKLKRQMFRLQHTGDHELRPGDELYKAGGGSAVGKVVDAVKTGGVTSRLLAVVSIDAVVDPLFADKDAQLLVELLELPYELPAHDCSGD